MPTIQWTGLPPALRDHLFDRLRVRKITAEDLYLLKLWRESDPVAPDGLWYIVAARAHARWLIRKSLLCETSLPTPDVAECQ